MPQAPELSEQQINDLLIGRSPASGDGYECLQRVINRLPAIKILAGSNVKYSSHPLGFLPTDRCRPRLCQNAVFIIMCQSQWQGKPNEAFH
jgi:hypothetical protein